MFFVRWACEGGVFKLYTRPQPDVTDAGAAVLPKGLYPKASIARP